MIPPVAATDSAKPTDPARAGAASNESEIAAPRAVQGVIETPAARPTRTSPAITEARMTEGSQRVTTTKTARPTRP